MSPLNSGKRDFAKKRPMVEYQKFARLFRCPWAPPQSFCCILEQMRSANKDLTKFETSMLVWAHSLRTGTGSRATFTHRGGVHVCPVRRGADRPVRHGTRAPAVRGRVAPVGNGVPDRGEVRVVAGGASLAPWTAPPVPRAGPLNGLPPGI
jgi:hypothetical protein